MIGKHGIEQTRKELATHDAAIKADVGDFSGQSNLTTLLAALGIPDTSGKPLYTCLITDRLDDATNGLANLKSLIDTADTAIDNVQADLGNFSGRTYDGTLMDVIGLPDVENKDLYTCLVTDRLDNVTYGLSALQTDIAAIPTTMVGTDLAFLASVGGALDDAAAAGAVTDADTAMAYIKQLVTAAIAIEADTSTDGVVLGTKAAAYKKLVGETQITETTEDLNQAAASYDLFTGTTQAVFLKGLSIKMPADLCDDTTLTSISIQTDDATPGVILSSVDGAVGNLTSEAELSWTGLMRINVGTKIQLTIAGGAEGAEYITTVTARYEAITDGGYLAT